MKYKNRLIVPTLISTALFGTALNAEAEEMSKEATETHIEMETVEAPDTGSAQSQEEQSTYINAKESVSAESTDQKEAVTETEAPDVEEEPVGVPGEEETVETLEEPAVENNDDINETDTPEETVEDASTEDAETGAEPVEPSPVEEPVSEESTETEPVEGNVQSISKETEESTDQAPVTENSEETVEAPKDNGSPVEKSTEESLEEVVEKTEAADSETPLPGEDLDEEQSEASVTEEVSEETELEEDFENEDAAEDQTAEIEDVDVSDDTDPETEDETSKEESTEEDIEAKVAEEEPLSEEAEILKENAEDIVVDEALEEELLTMLKTYDIEMDESRSFFTSTASAQPMTLAQVVTNINDYIKQNDFKAPSITYNHIAGLPKYSYRNGVGKPEGVVLHETANSSSTIHGEISWMSRNYNNAFVHAFVDKDNIIQVADTDYLAWGAGPNANPRFLHVELVRHHNAHDFAKSINNYADYIANLLYKYKLPVDSAEADADGTLWSHSAVSTHLGGTNHVDPYTYFSNFGYSYRDVEKLIEEKYMDLYNKKTAPKVTMPVTTSEAKYVGRIQDSNKGLYASVTDVKTSSTTGHLNKTFYVTRKATYNYDNYYLVQSDLNQAYVGWVHEDDLRRLDRTDPEDYQKSFTVKDLKSYIFDVPWGTGQQIERLSNYENDIFKSSKIIRIDNTMYTYGAFNGKTGWVKLSDLEDYDETEHIDPPQYSESSLAAKIKSSNNSGILTSLTGTTTVSANTLLDHTLYINKKAAYNSGTYYLVSKKYDALVQGWMREEDLNLWHLSEEENNTMSYTLTQRSGGLMTDPWGTEQQYVKPLTDYKVGTAFKSEKSIKLGALTFHYGKLGNDYGWIQNTRLDEVSSPPVYSDISFAAKIKSSTNSGVFNPITSSTGVSDSSLLNRTLYVNKEAQYNNEKYYLIHKEYGDRMQGWMKAKDLNVWHLSDETTNTKTYALTSKNGGLLSDPWGTEKQYVNKLTAYENNTAFEAEKTIKLGALTFYYGKMGDDYGWIQDTKVKDSYQTPAYSEASYASKIKSSTNSGLYSSITSSKSVSANTLINRTLYINKQAQYKGGTYYLIYKKYGDRMQGWMKAQDLNLWHISEENNNNNSYSLSNHTGGLLTDPWGTKEQYVKPLNAYNSDTVFEAQKTVSLGALTFHYGQLGNDYGWIQDTKLKDYVPSTPTPVVNTVKYDVSLDRAVDIQMNLGAKPQAWVSGGGWRDATRSEVEQYLNPANHTTDTWDYTYLDLNRAQNISSTELNNKLLDGKGILHNQGTAFLQAANTHGVNEVYLISHALHETGNGQSTLAQGVRLDANGNISENGKLYYNMYGIAAYDHNPVLEGARHAQRMGWDTPAKAVIGGAQFISGGYFNRGQTTLYAMRWNPENPGTYQYATDVNWAYATARNLKNYYDQLGLQGQYYTRYTF